MRKKRKQKIQKKKKEVRGRNPRAADCKPASRWIGPRTSYDNASSDKRIVRKKRRAAAGTKARRHCAETRPVLKLWSRFRQSPHSFPCRKAFYAFVPLFARAREWSLAMAKNGAGVSFGGTGVASAADWACEAMTVPAAVAARGIPRGIPGEVPQAFAAASPASDAGDAGDAGNAEADSCADAGADVGADARADSESPSLTAALVLRFLGRVSSTGDGLASEGVSRTARVRAGRENVGSK